MLLCVTYIIFILNTIQYVIILLYWRNNKNKKIVNVVIQSYTSRLILIYHFSVHMYTESGIIVIIQIIK